MKTILNIFIILSATLVSGQTLQTLNPITAFHDTTWEWSDGSNTFRVKLYDCKFMRGEQIDGNCMFLSYKMLSSSGNVIYETRPSTVGYNGNLPLGGILGTSNDPMPNIYGRIQDQTDSNYPYWIDGMLEIIYIPCQGTGCTPQISWKITNPKEFVQDPSAPDDYNLPTDIILTKVN